MSLAGPAMRSGRIATPRQVDCLFEKRTEDDDEDEDELRIDAGVPLSGAKLACGHVRVGLEDNLYYNHPHHALGPVLLRGDEHAGRSLVP